MKDATVSVVMPARNAERFIAEALRSILDQTSGRMETIVVDNGSTDGTRALAESFAHRGVTCIALPKNHGIAGGRNIGIAAASGEYLAFLDADDLWTPERTAVLGRALASHPGCAIALGHVEQFICPTMAPEQRRRLLAPRPRDPAYVAGGILLRRKDFLAVGPFDEGLLAGEFIDWFGRARRAGLREITVPDVVLRRRIHGANTTRQRQVVAADYLKVVRREIARQRTPERNS